MKHFGKVFAAAAMTGAIALAGSPIANAASLTIPVAPYCHTGQSGHKYTATGPDGQALTNVTGVVEGQGQNSKVVLTFDEPLEAGTYNYQIWSGGENEVKHSPDCAGSFEVKEEDLPKEDGTEDEGGNDEGGNDDGTEDEGDNGDGDNGDGDNGDGDNGDGDKGEGDKEECDEGTKDDCEGVIPGSSGSSLLLPAILLLGSSTWFLNQDGSTYVSSEDRVTETPTPEEKETSDKVKEENEEAIKEQGGEASAPEAPAQPAPEAAQPAPAAPAKGAPAQTAPAQTAPAATERGVSANTGDNSAAQGLFALAIAAMLGVAAFAVRRNYSA